MGFVTSEEKLLGMAGGQQKELWFLNQSKIWADGAERKTVLNTCRAIRSLRSLPHSTFLAQQAHLEKDAHLWVNSHDFLQ
jgi:hypothetical protein